MTSLLADSTVQGAILPGKPMTFALTAQAPSTSKPSPSSSPQPANTTKPPSTMSYPSLAPFVVKRPWLRNLLTPIASWYSNAAGYRQLGLLSDDLIVEENEDVLKALQRLSPQEAYDRVYRLRRAIQCSVTHKLLPKDQWTKPEDDVPYLTPLIQQIRAAELEKESLDTLTIVKGH
ncbi:hypothetical protein GQX73_g6480 [Xylaria multiplex]|uniref:Complex III subunit 7 n=1 Tax=Xylaria multiplex TaxID=323545 RepID=A0A7C8IRC8_9PEZI|nr:hypothetical protein GQX73_g6480 [Xylaria multiplex]